MKRILILSLSLMLLGQLSFGQDGIFTWGIKGGASVTNFNLDPAGFASLDLGIDVGTLDNLDPTLDPTVTINPTDFLLQQSGAAVGFHGGIFARIKLLGLFIQPELYFSSTSSELTVSDVTVAVGEEDYRDFIEGQVLTQSYSKIDFPILFGIKLGPLRVNAGPVGSYVFSSKTDLQEFFVDYEDISSKATFGYQAGIGLDLLKKISLDVRYEGSLSKFGAGATVGGTDVEFDSRPSQVVGSIAIMF